MELSNIQKSGNRTSLLEQLNLFAELNATKIALWQKKETDKLLNDVDNVYIVPVQNGFKVGKSAVYKKPFSWIVTCKSAKREAIDFNTKEQALLYALLIENDFDEDARDFRDTFLGVQKHQNDIQFYKHGIKAAKKRDDAFRAESLSFRLDDSISKLQNAQNKFEKSIKSAKYIKLRDIRK